MEKTCLSISTELFDIIKDVATENGMSQNAAILMLIRLGSKLYNAEVSVSVNHQVSPQ